MSNGAIVAAAVVLIVLGALAIWFAPLLQVHLWRRGGIADREKLAELEVDARSSVTQAVGGLALILTLAITAYQANDARRTAQATQSSANANLKLANASLHLAEQSQVSERFSKAVEQLGASNTDGTPATDVRTGGLFSLLRIGLDSGPNRQPSFLVVAAYVRNNYVPPAAPRPHGCDASFTKQRPDIAVALIYVLPQIAAKLYAPGVQILGLRGTKFDGIALDGLSLERFDLTRAKFRNASLNRADFRHAHLAQATFDRACLRQADFRGANLRGSRFTGAVLEGASFSGANLKGASFTREALAEARLSNAQREGVIVVPG